MSAAHAFANSPDAEESLENQLKLSLQRVQPNPEFVGHLYNRLKTPAETTIERRQNAALGLFLVVISLLSGALLVWLLRQFRAA